jgi:hypothetical protein
MGRRVGRRGTVAYDYAWSPTMLKDTKTLVQVLTNTVIGIAPLEGRNRVCSMVRKSGFVNTHNLFYGVGEGLFLLMDTFSTMQNLLRGDLHDLFHGAYIPACWSHEDALSSLDRCW